MVPWFGGTRNERPGPYGAAKEREMTMGESGSMLSPKSLAQRWDCKLGYVYKQIRDGKLASVKFGPHMVRIPMSDILRFEDEIWNKQALNGDLESIEEATPPSSEAALAADASRSMRLTRALRNVS
jgi:excisionase family DNA binding protein